MVKSERKQRKIKKQQQMKKESSLLIDALDLIRVVFVCFILATLLSLFVFRRVSVVGSSMDPTLHDKDEGVTNILGYLLFGVDRFDVVVVKPPVAAADTEDELWVKRVVGLPGDTISYQDNVLTVNGEIVDEPYVVSDPKTYKKGYDFGPITLGEGEYFLMGDNRDYSKDSRIVGTFNENQILSKDIMVAYPFSHFRIVGGHDGGEHDGGK